MAGRDVPLEFLTPPLLRELTLKFFRRFAISVGTVAELLSYFGDNKRWWLLPMLIILFLFGALIMAAQSSVIGPFIYSIF